MTEETHTEALGADLAARLGLGQGNGPQKLVLQNPEWAEAAKLGQLLLDHLDTQDAARHSPTETTTEPEGTTES